MTFSHALHRLCCLPLLYLSLFSVIINNVRLTGAVELNIDDPASIKSAASTIAYGMMKYYKGNVTGQTPGLLPQPYFWWEAGAMFGQMVEYQYYTGDKTYNDVTTAALLYQVGPQENYMPPNQSASEGNDDQAFWSFAVMSAAELNYPNPPSGNPSWLALAQAVFNIQTTRWDLSSCAGGFRWQIYPTNNGWTYKNAIANGGFFQLAARLARYTKNETYADWAEKAYDWASASPLFEGNYQINDGTSTTNNCTDASHIQWTYNYATYIVGAAYLYNYTNGSAVWEERLTGMLNATSQFFVGTDDQVMSEIACETLQSCNNDQPSFKAYMSRWFAMTMQLAPFTAGYIQPRLRASAIGAAAQCSGGTDGVTCGRRWYQSTWDGEFGVGEQMSALGIMQANLMQSAAAPVSADTGGTSQSDPSAGTGADADPTRLTTISKSDKIGAGILTAVLIVVTLGGAVWMVT